MLVGSVAAGCLAEEMAGTLYGFWCMGVYVSVARVCATEGAVVGGGGQ